MTKQRDLVRCAWCGSQFPAGGGPGRPRRFCKRSHRQRHFEARRAASKLGLKPGEVLVAESDLADLRDRIFILEAALDDVEGDLAGSPTMQDYADAYVHLLEGALPLRRFRIEPRALAATDEER